MADNRAWVEAQHAYISACNARIYGMMTANYVETVRGATPPYGEDAFQAEANLLEGYAANLLQYG